MEFIVIAYRSREETLRFYSFLNKYGVGGEIVNTPKEAGVGCGLSVKINKNDFMLAKRIVFAFKGSTFAGFFAVKIFAGKRTVRAI